MTEASKARKRSPMRMLTMGGPPMSEEKRRSMLNLVRMSPQPIVFPSEGRLIIFQPQARRPISVLLSGVSVRAGVGGRRGERRRRARERAESRGAARMLAGAAWEMVTNPALQRPWKEKPLRDAFEDLRARLAAFTGQLRG